MVMPLSINCHAPSVLMVMSLSINGHAPQYRGNTCCSLAPAVVLLTAALLLLTCCSCSLLYYNYIITGLLDPIPHPVVGHAPHHGVSPQDPAQY